jgi:hypothetical protein
VVTLHHHNSDYVILPYIPSVSPTTPTDSTYAAGVAAIVAEEKALSVDNKMPWGAILGTLEVGDYVKATASGRLTKWLKDRWCRRNSWSSISL